MQQYENGHLMDAVNSTVQVPSFSEYGYQVQPASTQETNFCSVSQEDLDKVLNGVGLDLGFSGSKSNNDLTPWDDLSEHTAAGLPSVPFPDTLEIGVSTADSTSKQLTLTFGELPTNDLNIAQKVDTNAEQKICSPEVCSSDPSEVNVKADHSTEGNMNPPFSLKQPPVEFPNIGEGLKKYDSFSNWMSGELAEVDDSNITSSAQVWNYIECDRPEESGMSNPGQDAYIVGPSVSQDQLFNIIDFSPNWAFSGSETKVLVTGRFLKGRKDVENIKLSCMFGEVEVPAEILADGILRCHAPTHSSGRVPFYITCSNRLACSEVREFEYRINHSGRMETFDSSIYYANEMNFHIRLGKLLSLGSIDQPSAISVDTSDKLHIRSKICSLLKEADDKWFNMLKSSEKDLSPDCVKDQLLQKLLNEKLHDWLLSKVSEDGKGPNILDKDGQGVLHLTAALGYDWAIKPIITAGVNINFRDVHGWTALHWAACCGRERTVVSLVTLGAAPGALTDPTPEFPSGRTPADLASGNGHKGIAGFLAESSLTSHLSVLAIRATRGIDLTDASVVEDLKNLEEQSAIQIVDGNVETGLSLKDSLSAVRNASLAAARIHQVFRADSFQRKKLVDFGHDHCGISEEQTLSLVSLKTSKPREHDMPVHVAAIRIQNKFRGWKGRKDFLIIRQRIVKIQAHVRGHQVRKRHKKIVWTVGIVEKAILRWRRKGSGLRGFRKEGHTEGISMQIEHQAKDDDYDFLKEGRKQTEARLQTALSRVKSMVRYPEAREQYRRLLTVVSHLKKSNDVQESVVNGSEDVAAEDDIIIEQLELEGLCEEDASFMQMQ